jgi:nitrogen fixation-related uncharacterized protein
MKLLLIAVVSVSCFLWSASAGAQRVADDRKVQVDLSQLERVLYDNAKLRNALIDMKKENMRLRKDLEEAAGVVNKCEKVAESLLSELKKTRKNQCTQS